MKRYPLLWLLALALLLPSLACNLVDQVLEPAPTFAPPPTAGGPVPATSTSPDPTATPIGGSIGVPTPTPAAAASPTAISLAELGEPPEEVTALGTWLAQAYDAEAPIDTICALLRDAAWMADDATCEAAALDGAEGDEWLLALYLEPLLDPASVPGVQGPSGDFWILGEEGIRYQMHGPENTDWFGQVPTLVELADMTGDEYDEAILMYVMCGAHTCYNNYEIVSAEGDSLRNVVLVEEAPVAEFADVIAMAYVSEEEVSDATEDELPDLVISGGIIGSAGAGIQRARREVWAWDGEAITLADQEWEDTGYRFHRLYNANYAFGEGEYEEARPLYESVIVDPTLEEEAFAYTSEAVRAATRQFAGFRLALMPLIGGDITEATRWSNWLQEEYPQTPLAAAAPLLIDTWQQNGNDLAGACERVTAFLDDQPEPTGPLEDMGYGNPSLTAETVCPF